MRWGRVGLVLLGVLLHALVWAGVAWALSVPAELTVLWLGLMSCWVALESLAREDGSDADPGDVHTWTGITAVLGVLLLGLATHGAQGFPVALRGAGLLAIFAGASMRLEAVRALADAFRARPELRRRPLLVGPYMKRRHPAELGLILCLLGSSLVLASAWAVLSSLTLLPLLTQWRVLAEERALLRAGAPGYEAYLRDVPRW